MSARLENRVAFVTGGASGIGAATARRLATEGARVVIADIDVERGRRVAAEVEGAWVRCDVTDTASVRSAVDEGERDLGPIDILVNNAGGDRFGMFVDSDEAGWDHVIALNLRSTFACTHAVLGAMQRRGGGNIVNVASEAGRMGTAAGATYSAAKAGVIGFTKAIAREAVGHGVRVNAVAPGPIDTPLLNDSAAEMGAMGARIRQAMIDATAMRRVGTPEEVAAVVAFLASDDASFLTGQTIAVSGGISMW